MKLWSFVIYCNLASSIRTSLPTVSFQENCPNIVITSLHVLIQLSLSLLVFSSLQALQKVHETFQSDIEAENNRIGQLEALAQELNDYRYSQADAINARMQVSRRGCG